MTKIKLTKLLYLLTILLFTLNQTKAEDNSQIPDHPLTDKLHAEVYGFVVDYLKERIEFSRQEALENNKLEQELLEENRVNEIENPLYIQKPMMACAYEGEMSSILNVFCRNNPHCNVIALYKRNGEISRIGESSDNLPMTDISFIIESDIYDKYDKGIYFSPQKYKREKQFIYPIYIDKDGIACHNQRSYGGKLIGFIVYEMK